ncbi:MAG: S9 family peptidase [Gammaproteobacteria bacterium]
MNCPRPCSWRRSYLDNGYWYYTRYQTGQQYPIHARRRDAPDAAEEVLLDGNARAAGHDFYQIGDWVVSPDNRTLAWFEDTAGRNQFTLRFRDLASGTDLPVTRSGLSAGGVWTGDSSGFLYVENDPSTLLTTHVRALRDVREPAATDPVVYTESDTSFYMGLFQTTSREYLCIVLQSTVSAETRCTRADQPGAFTVFEPRARDHEYQVDHVADQWIIRTNWDAPNFRLMSLSDTERAAAAADEPKAGSRARWRERIAHDPNVFLNQFAAFDGFVAVSERAEGLMRLRILRPDGTVLPVAADETAYAMALDVNREPGSDVLRYTYSSLATPTTVFEVSAETGERRVLKVQPVLGDFDPARYVTERRWATARDGARIPVSLLYRRDVARDATAPAFVYGYGSYGASMDPYFNSGVLSLVDRGVVYAIAHIRGGQEMGRAWYDDGKLLKKMNTFTDFIDVTDFLIAERYAAPGRVAAAGGSAGGLLMGAVANLASEKYAVIVSQVPFVDVVTTMLDPTIPLTTNEYDEWGNPEDPVYYDYQLAYSPYDQLKPRAYPAMFVSTGLWDSQVQYWEPAKYVARLRARKTDANPLVFRVNMQAGHGGKSGRFERYREVAEYYAFMLDRLGVSY